MEFIQIDYEIVVYGFWQKIIAFIPIVFIIYRLPIYIHIYICIYVYTFN